MRACQSPDAIAVTFANAGLLLAATLAEGLGLRDLLDTCQTSR